MFYDDKCMKLKEGLKIYSFNKYVEYFLKEWVDLFKKCWLKFMYICFIFMNLMNIKENLFFCYNWIFVYWIVDGLKLESRERN